MRCVQYPFPFNHFIAETYSLVLFFPLFLPGHYRSAARPIPPLLLRALLMQIGNHGDVGRVLDDYIVPNLKRRHNARIMEAAMTCLGLCALVGKVRPSLPPSCARKHLIISYHICIVNFFRTDNRSEHSDRVYEDDIDPRGEKHSRDSGYLVQDGV
jgi:hypothetical protein